MRFVSPLALVLLVLLPAYVSGKGLDEESKTSQDAQLLDENTFFRVSRLGVDPRKTVTLNDGKHDLIIITLSGKSLTSTNQNGTSTSLSEGDVRFEGRGGRIAISNTGQNPAQLIVAALKHHFDAEIHLCADPHKCTHPIQTGPMQIGETTLLFTSGFITVYSHRLDRGGTLASSYYSSNGKDHLLLIARTDLQANFDGQEEQLVAGQVYTSDAGQVEVSAASAEARWIVIRMQLPKHTE